ncbi:RteC domain-containing protein [Paraflavitalea sp. CAU 1676]|uniref:RteC domain-containing protein n=1 Tax=Paraflavitalea sp. CAU 1676 TaxID=3032598 RepID=UPI0023DC68AD|nr:RteC domain-containing protein [Paraflavitalea sp. CAU 1676]MDF2188710.1 RteC domain-containing protein [Paraflavitalea sp. CAU 1676]
MKDKAVFYETLDASISRQELRMTETGEGMLKMAEGMLLFLKEALRDLRKFAEENTFLDEGEEIGFYKKQLPGILSHFFYYVKIYSLELRLLMQDDPARKKLLKKERKTVDEWIRKNEGFFRYYKSGTTDLDNKYFMKSSTDFKLLTDPAKWLFDDPFITVPAYLIGELLAYERYRDYLNHELKFFDEKKKAGAGDPDDGLVWTATKMAAVEVLYGLYSSAAYNNGNAQLRHIAKRVEKLTGIDLGNYYRYSLDLKIKKVRNQFLKKMLDSSNKRMDEQDENPRSHSR